MLFISELCKISIWTRLTIRVPWFVLLEKKKANGKNYPHSLNRLNISYTNAWIRRVSDFKVFMNFGIFAQALCHSKSFGSQSIWDFRLVMGNLKYQHIHRLYLDQTIQKRGAVIDIITLQMRTFRDNGMYFHQ